MKRMAFNCLELTSHAPETFEQGLQLFWFIWRLRSNFTSCIGRMDVHLQSLYERDVPQRISQDKKAEPFHSFVAGIVSEAHLDNQGHVSRSVQTAKIFLFGRERRKDRQ